MTTASFRNLTLSFPGTEEAPHFDRAAFKVTGRRIYTTMREADCTVNVALTPAEQKAFCSLDPEHIYPVPNKWGLNGWTTFEIAHVDEAVVREALSSAYTDVMQSKAKKRR